MKSQHTTTDKSPLSKVLSARLIHFIKNLISLDEDKEDAATTIAAIRKGTEFKGSNLWVLIFAIFIASIGLNVNSTAVVIGAMLISPLMGPIMGIGMGIGINDPELIKKGLQNLITAVLISVAASTIYFLITPLNDAQSELLARTTPTLWDVLIAVFGGLAGIVAYSRKEKSNAIPGVAIATALMPPLCTAGYGLSTGQLNFFFGAFYLFFINSVFICFSTFIIVRYLKYPHKSFSTVEQEQKVKRLILLFVLIAVVPSCYTGYKVVRKSIFEHNANLFIQNELNFENANVVSKNINYSGKHNSIEVLLLGSQISDSTIKVLQGHLKNYGLSDTKLTVRQGYDKSQENSLFEKLNRDLKTSMFEEFYNKNQATIMDKDQKIKMLENEILKIQDEELPVDQIARELKVINPTLKEFSISKAIMVELNSDKKDTLLLATGQFSKQPTPTTLKKMTEWLKARTNSKKLKLILEN